jgi:hypothetical protein
MSHRSTKKNINISLLFLPLFSLAPFFSFGAALSLKEELGETPD